MSTDTPRSASARRNRLLPLGLAGVALLVIVTLVAIALANRGSAAAPTPVATTSPSTRPSPAPSPGATASPPPTATTAGPTPTPVAGAANPTVPGETALDVPIDAQPQTSPGVAVKLTELVSVQGTADEPGEIAGPALRFTVQVSNSTGDQVSLRDASVTVDYGQGREPASQLNDAKAVALPESVGARGTASGSYIFSVPTKARDLVRISVFLSVDTPIVVFTGQAPR